MGMVTAIATAFCSCSVCCGPHAKHGLTKSGVRPVEGRTVAAPSWVPLGSKVEITTKSGRKLILVAEDRTHPKHDGVFDVYHARHRDAVRWGRQEVRVKIVQRRR